MNNDKPRLVLLPLGNPIRREDRSGSEVAPLETEGSRLVWDDDARPFSSGLWLGAGVAAAIALGLGLAALAAVGFAAAIR